MTTIYISGPIAGIEEHNFPAFHAAASQLCAKGFTVVNPAEIALTVRAAIPEPAYEDYIRADVKLLMDCDAVATLPGHRKSIGAGIECRLARELRMTVRPLARWLA